MPTYEYRCDACGHRFDHFQSMSSRRLRKCPACGKPKLIRLVGAGAGLIFKGSGFYETDYKRKSSSGPAGKAKSEPAGDGGSDASSSSKGAKDAPDAKSAGKAGTDDA